MKIIRGNFSTMKVNLEKMSVPAVDGVLLDLGVSSRQLDDAARGFSFRQGGRLDMRMDRVAPKDARHVVNTYDEKTLAGILFEYGEERHARKIASRIVQRRAEREIESTEELASAVRSVVGNDHLTKSLARIFQAIRIEVNHELDHLRLALNDAVGMLNVGGRIVVISYHSLEDRIVKETFRDEARKTIPSGSKFLPDRPRVPRLAILTRKPLMAGEEEQASNPRSRSAKLRAAEKIHQ
jgi:16S rRNA (cytosine1402-N4)-methyltransferase